MMPLQRYRLVYWTDLGDKRDAMAERDPDGDWVSIDDVAPRIAELEEAITLALEYPLTEVMRQTAHRQLYNAVHKDKPLCSRCLYRHAGECRKGRMGALGNSDRGAEEVSQIDDAVIVARRVMAEQDGRASPKYLAMRLGHVTMAKAVLAMETDLLAAQGRIAELEAEVQALRPWQCALGDEASATPME